MKRRSSPKPAQVRYNDWRQVALPPPEEFTPALPVSVIMPCYQTPPAVLARTLAALAGQTWPRDLFEVVIVDDGSEPPLAPPPGAPPNVRVVRQERRGFGIARARNTGVRAAAHGIILFLDGDSLPEAGWLAAHARWHHAVSDVVTVGFRASVAMEDLEAEAIRGRPGTLRELFADRPVDAPWIDGHLLRMADMTTRAADLFHVVVGGNFGIGREFYRATGGSDESFMRWGIEDTELAYRAYTRGGLFVPVRSALVWHQGREAEGREAKERSLRLQMGKAANLIPHPRYRSAARGRIYAVPRYVATVEAGRSAAEQVAEAVVNLLTDRAHDLVVRIEIDGKHDAAGLAWLREVFGPDPRVRIAPARSALDQFPAAPFHVRLPATAAAKNLVHALHYHLRGAVLATSLLPDGTSVSIARTWALQRARRAGGNLADFGDVRELAPAKLKLKPAPAPGTARAAARNAAGLLAGWRSLRARARDVYDLREAWWFVRWVAWSCRRRLLRRTGTSSTSRTGGS